MTGQTEEGIARTVGFDDLIDVVDVVAHHRLDILIELP